MQSAIAAQSGLPMSDVDPFSLEYIMDPFAAHEQLRNLGSVVWLNKYNVWFLTRYEEVHAVLSNPKTFCSSKGLGLTNYYFEKPWRAPSLLLEADPPEHTKRRQVMGRVLSPANIRKLREGFEQEARALIDRLMEKEIVNGAKDLSEAYILKVFPDAIGVSPEGRENMLKYGLMVFNAFGIHNKIFEDSVKDAEPVISWIMSCCERDRLSKNGMGELVYQAADAGELPQDEALMLVRSFLSAGVDTTITAITNILYAFTQFPGEWQKLRANPALARQAVEEGLRYETPWHHFCRTSTEETTIAGAPIAAKQKIMLSIGSANRDPRKWDNPDVFDINRIAHGQLAFGTNIHGCVGQMLSRLEKEVLFTELAKRIESIELAGEPTRVVHNTMRIRSNLPLKLKFAAKA
ncbi:cytochrome P450 [Lacisediminimonas sp.]|uniref:cytochrome P450 n=1 Tax=Lacisediminimonas sp. TaxID=3060582 RepID=UPI002717D7D7|nr:cytochrome P450 [Lacisediminimonas sp.]MDO8300694.1 cytochrome P450 [Lacisediminimonas sp.]